MGPEIGNRFPEQTSLGVLATRVSPYSSWRHSFTPPNEQFGDWGWTFLPQGLYQLPSCPLLRADFIRQSSLDLSGHVVGEHLIVASFDRTQHLPNYLRGLDLWKSELTRHIGVDRAGVHSQDLRALLTQAGP